MSVNFKRPSVPPEVVGWLLRLTLLTIFHTSVGPNDVARAELFKERNRILRLRFVSGAKVVSHTTRLRSTQSLTTNLPARYTSGALDPGSYKVQVTAKGFQQRQRGVDGEGWQNTRRAKH